MTFYTVLNGLTKNITPLKRFLYKNISRTSLFKADKYKGLALISVVFNDQSW